MNYIFDYMKSIFPNEWLLRIYGIDEFGDAEVDIAHPANKDIYLSIVILPERVGIALLKYSEMDILIDIGGFDYSFEEWEKEKLQIFLLHFYQTGQVHKF